MKPQNELTGKKPMLSDTHAAALAAYVELIKLKNYSNNTLLNYRNWFLFFLSHFPGRKPSGISKNEILDFMVAFRNSRKWSATTQNQLEPVSKISIALFQRLLPPCFVAFLAQTTSSMSCKKRLAWQQNT